ncbi:MAG: hypothetical protein FJ029_06925 [Actinobacteria bacterium]|nr:hypothetical protein [Actinomycetota bacterium]
MAAQCASFRSALAWYADHVSKRRRLTGVDAGRQLAWIREFCASFPRRAGPTEVTQRDVVVYFAERCDRFAEPLEWYYRYKAVETFYDEMSRTFALPVNHIRGLYDESDLAPELQRRIPMRDRLVPVNWSRKDDYAY